MVEECGGGFNKLLKLSKDKRCVDLNLKLTQFVRYEAVKCSNSIRDFSLYFDKRITIQIWKYGNYYYLFDRNGRLVFEPNF